MLTRNHRQEALCRAYVQAVAALAGVSTAVPTPDYGIDLCLRSIEQQGEQRGDVGVQLDLQLRSTTRAPATETEVRFDLDTRTYDLLRGTPPVPRILVVLVLPADETLWLSQSDEELVVRHSAYWRSFRGAPAVTAASSVRVVMQRQQIFSVDTVRALLGQLSRGEFP